MRQPGARAPSPPTPVESKRGIGDLLVPLMTPLLRVGSRRPPRQWWQPRRRSRAEPG